MAHLRDNRFDYWKAPSSITPDKTLSQLVMKPKKNLTTFDQAYTRQNADRPHPDRAVENLVMGHPLNAERSRSRSSSVVSIKSLVLYGKWRYREDDNDKHRLRVAGIENLVHLCGDIMNTTYQAVKHKRSRDKIYSPIYVPWPTIKYNEFNKLTKANKASMEHAGMLNLMQIVYEAALSSATISDLVLIWREASAPRASVPRKPYPSISHEQGIRHLVRRPDNPLLEIAIHASLVNIKDSDYLKRLGKALGIRSSEFQMNTIPKSKKAFRDFMALLREKRLEEERWMTHIDKTKLPYARRKKEGLSVNVLNTKFPLVRIATDALGFSTTSDSDFTCNLLWNDSLISMDIVSALKPYQKINHFPAMNEIARKNSLAAHYEKVAETLPSEYNFTPKTWILPKDYDLWYLYASMQQKKSPLVYIVKPSHGMSAQGITIHCDYTKIKPMDDHIIQEYIQEPYLLNGLKFDLRVYVLITSCDPLRVFIFDDFLVRKSSKNYQKPNPKNASIRSMHLPNYPINDTDDIDVLDSSATLCHSRSYLFDCLIEQKKDHKKLWSEIQNIVLKTVFLAEPHLLASYRQCRPGALPTSESVCFEILGFDILVDKNLKPWVIEVNRCPSFHASSQLEFDVKLKLLSDALNLLHFQVSDKKTSVALEKAEARHNLLVTMGKDTLESADKLNRLKQTLQLVQREKQREELEKRLAGGWIRLFPVNEQHMNDLMNILVHCFRVLYSNKTDLSWTKKYYGQYDEQELNAKIAQLEKTYSTDRKTTAKSPEATSKRSGLSRSSSSISVTSENIDDKNGSPLGSARSDRRQRSSSSRSHSSAKQASTQTPVDIMRSSSQLSLNVKKKRPKSHSLTGNVSGPSVDSGRKPPGVSANRITVSKSYSSDPTPSEHGDRPRSHSPKPKTHHQDKSQMVTHSSIIRARRDKELQNQSTTIDMKRELQLTDDDLNRLHQSVFDQMNKMCIRYPNKPDKETKRICTEIIDNWTEYKPQICRYWLGECDSNTRQSIVNIVWTKVQQIVKKVCIVDELAEQLPLNRHLMKLRRRLLAQHGQCLWDTCLNNHNSWKSLFVKSTNCISSVELDCCYCFVNLCQQALFVVYRFTADEKHSQKQQINQGLTVTVKS